MRDASSVRNPSANSLMSWKLPVNKTNILHLSLNGMIGMSYPKKGIQALTV